MILIPFLFSCTSQRLSIQKQYLTKDFLASAHIGTPDPTLDRPFFGQRLLVQWSLSAEEFSDCKLNLYLKVRFRNRQEEELVIPIESKRGTYLYQINSERLSETGGILTYFGEIRSSTESLATWIHPLWVPLISFSK